ncbi:MAG: hypothetical protein JWO26_167, partial [Rhodospirillales bacterium]|nr:hypothetical protein [Rhodospirillales bacterium]
PQPQGGPRPQNPTAELARTAGRLLAEAEGPRESALDMGGWDTPAGQAQRLPNTFGALDEALGALRGALGPVWRRTAVLVMTEFGRTASLNGSGGTDHGTGGAAFLLGGAVAGGRVIADWLGLAPDELFERGDLAPTADLRGLILPLLREHLRLPEPTIAATFPDAGGFASMRGLLRS